MMAECLARVNIAEVNFDDRHLEHPDASWIATEVWE